MAVSRFLLWLTSLIAVAFTAYLAGLALVLWGNWDGVRIVYVVSFWIALTLFGSAVFSGGGAQNCLVEFL